MNQQVVDDVSASIGFVTFLYVMWKVWLWPIFLDRPVKVRDDAPTGEQPWTRPRDRLAG
jgi:hypothetical protein